MTALVETSHGKRRPRGIRPDRHRPSPTVAALAAPFQDPITKRFTAGNPGGKLKRLKALEVATAESLLRLDADKVAPWLRPHLDDAQEHAQGLISGLRVASDELVALCADEARARLFASACSTEGARLDCPAEDAREWRKEAREWIREARQVALTRKALERETQPEADPSDGFAAAAKPVAGAGGRP